MHENYLTSNYYLLTRTFLFIVKRLHRRVISDLGKKLGGTVLDVGCGNQPYRHFIKCERYVGIDLDAGRKPTVVADAQVLPFACDVVDSVLCAEVIEHVQEPEQVIKEIYRVLKPGGVLLLTAPMSWGLHYEPNDYWRFTPYGLHVLLERHGFTVEEMVRIGGLFSLIGARLVEGVALEGWKKLRFLPRRFRHAVLLVFSIPVSLVFALMGDLLDRWFQADAIGHAVVASKK